MNHLRDLDYLVAKNILKWKETNIPADYYGKNACVVLTATGKIPEGYQLPNIGTLHPAFFVPQYSTSLQLALELAKRVNLDLNKLPLDAKEIVKECLK